MKTIAILFMVIAFISCKSDGNKNSMEGKSKAGTDDSVNQNYIDPTTTPANTTTVSPDGVNSSNSATDSAQYNPVTDRNKNDSITRPK